MRKSKYQTTAPNKLNFILALHEECIVVDCDNTSLANGDVVSILEISNKDFVLVYSAKHDLSQVVWTDQLIPNTSIAEILYGHK